MINDEILSLFTGRAVRGGPPARLQQHLRAGPVSRGGAEVPEQPPVHGTQIL